MTEKNMICITKEAAEMLNKMLEETESGEKMLTLSSAGAGCGSPAIRIEMRPPLEEDIIAEIDGFTVHIRPSIKRFLKDAEITVEDTFWGKKLKVKTAFGCS